jgi:hypothetical protein
MCFNIFSLYSHLTAYVQFVCNLLKVICSFQPPLLHSVTGKLCFAFPNKYNTTTALDRKGDKSL